MTRLIRSQGCQRRAPPGIPLTVPLSALYPFSAGSPLDRCSRHHRGNKRKGRREAAVMAFIQGTSETPKHKTFNIDFPIGPGRVNNRDDVMLVQKLLRFVYVE